MDDRVPTGQSESNPTEIQLPEKKRPLGVRIFLWILLAGLAFGTYIFYPIIRDILKSGILADVKMRVYSGNSMSNLKAMHRALLSYQESEDRFPFANGWMDVAEKRIQTYDMKKDETAKTLVSPEFVGQAGKYGYAMNDAASGLHQEDIPEPDTTPLLFDSSDLTRNAHGKPDDLLPKPPRNGQNLGISVSGAILKL